MDKPLVADPFSSSFFKVRNSSKLIVLDLIRYTPEGISRAEIARQAGLSRSAVTSIVNNLLAGELVRENEDGPATGGRRPILLEINPQRGTVVGIDIGVTHLSIVVTDLSSRVIHEIEIPFDATRDPEICFSEVDGRLRHSLEEASLTLGDVLAIGLGVPGPVVANAGMMIEPPLIPLWHEFPIKSYLETLWGRPLSVNNDAELGALGEWVYGAGRGESHLVYVKVGTGVGAGLLVGGQIYRGVTGSAGEIGHTMLNSQGPLCSCGSHGCLEAMAGGRAIAQKAVQAVAAGRRTQLANIKKVEEITAEDVAFAARMGDLVAQEIVTQAGEALGIAVANLINLINPGVVVVGGGMAQIGDLLLEPIRLTVENRGLRAAVDPVRITAAILGWRSSSMGAISQALTYALYHMVDDLSV